MTDWRICIPLKELKELGTAKHAEGKIYKQRQQSLMSRGVTREHDALLPRDPSASMPNQVTNDLEVHRRKALRAEIKEKDAASSRGIRDPMVGTN